MVFGGPGLILAIIGLVLWLATTAHTVGIILLVVGLILMFAGPYGHSHYYSGRRGGPPVA